MPITITDENLNDEILNFTGKVLIDFRTSHCKSCQKVGMILEEISREASDSDIIVGSVNIDEQPELVKKFGITSVPAVVVMRNGRLFAKRLGINTKEAILELLLI